MGRGNHPKVQTEVAQGEAERLGSFSGRIRMHASCCFLSVAVLSLPQACSQTCLVNKPLLLSHGLERVFGLGFLPCCSRAMLTLEGFAGACTRGAVRGGCARSKHKIPEFIATFAKCHHGEPGTKLGCAGKCLYLS